MVTYCTNIHPAECWNDIFANVRRYVPEVKKQVLPHAPFPVGLRLSGLAAAELDVSGAEEFHEWCGQHDCYVATINGFPFGTFHNVPIKESVYLPDWRHDERLDYTKRLARLLAVWLPAGMTGSISTVPVGFKACIDTADAPRVRNNLLAILQVFDHIAQTTGKEILLAMEPEPGCVLETSLDVVRFYEELALPVHLRPYLAVCYDCCHQALQYESPVDSLKLFGENSIRIGNVQVSSALRLEQADLACMRRFCEPCYLHQTVGRRRDNSLVRYNDLEPALAAAAVDILEWRIHFHIPVFIDQLTDCASTQPFLKEILPLFGNEVPLEVETYTWTVLPADLQTATVTESIVREIDWVRRARAGSIGKSTPGTGA